MIGYTAQAERAEAFRYAMLGKDAVITRSAAHPVQIEFSGCLARRKL